jgi:hypothetical protein
MQSVNAETNKALAILKAAEEGNYGVPGVVSVSISIQENLLQKKTKLIIGTVQSRNYRCC